MPKKTNTGEYISPQLLLMEIATENGIAISDATIVAPDFGESENEW